MTMLLPKEIRVIDHAYRQSARTRMCENCGAPDPVGAHPRAGALAGIAQKPTDSLLLFLCHRCHLEQEDGGVAWLARLLMEKILKLPWPKEAEPGAFECLWIVRWQLHPLLRKRYAEWKARQ